METIGRRALLVTGLACLSCNAISAAPGPNAQVAAAQLLLDTYYGNSAKLDEAVALLEAAALVKPWSAELLTQAARATVMGGHVVRDEFRGGTIERELALLEEATRLNPKYAKPYILRSEALRSTNRPEEALRQLEIAKSLQPDDPWLWNGYADLYWRNSERAKAEAAWARAAALATGRTEESRKALVRATTHLARAAAAKGDIAAVRRFAAGAEKHRHREDAWSLGDLSGAFFMAESFDESIEFARSALKVMNYGVGRRWLATALYAKACDEFDAGRPWQSFVQEARSLGFAPADVAPYFSTFKSGAGSARASIMFGLPELPPLESDSPAPSSTPRRSTST